MSRKSAELLLAAVIMARSSSFLFTKAGLGSMAPLNLLCVRFLLAFFILALIFRKRLLRLERRDVAHGALLGAVFFSVMVCETIALKSTEASTTSFLENTAIVIVPLLNALLCRRLPGKRAVFSALLTLAGVGFLTLRNGISIGGGELLCLLGALLYSAAIILTDRLSRDGDALMLGVLQIGFMGLFATAGSFIFEQPRLPDGSLEWTVILALALVCSCFGFTLQPLAQRYTSAERTGQFCALNPLTASLLAAIFMHERLGVCGLIGAALILCGILAVSIHKKARIRDSSQIRTFYD